MAATVAAPQPTSLVKLRAWAFEQFLGGGAAVYRGGCGCAAICIDASRSASGGRQLRAWYAHPRHANPSCVVHRGGSVRSELYTMGTIGGTIGGVVGNTGTGLHGHSQQTRFSTGWDRDRLVIQITNNSGHPADAGDESEHKEVWSLDAQGALLVSITDSAPGTGPTTTTLMYRRRP